MKLSSPHSQQNFTLLFVVCLPFIVIFANCKQIFVWGNNDISKYVATYLQQLLHNAQALNATLPKACYQQQQTKQKNFHHNDVATLHKALQEEQRLGCTVATKNYLEDFHCICALLLLRIFIVDVMRFSYSALLLLLLLFLFAFQISLLICWRWQRDI